MAENVPSWVRPGAFLTTVESSGGREDVGENDTDAKVRSYRVVPGAEGGLAVEVKGRGGGGEETFTTSVQDWLEGMRMELPARFPKELTLGHGDLKLKFTLVEKDEFIFGGAARPCRHIRAPLERKCSCAGSGSCPLCGGTGNAKSARTIDVWVDDETGILLKFGFYDGERLGTLVRLTSTNIFGPAPVKAKGRADAGKRRR